MWTPLHNARLIGDLEAAKYLVARGANVNAVTVYGWTPLFLACELGFVDITRVLIGAGTDVNAVNDVGNSALHYACSSTRTGAIPLLLQAGADAWVRNEDLKRPVDYELDESTNRIVGRTNHMCILLLQAGIPTELIREFSLYV